MKLTPTTLIKITFTENLSIYIFCARSLQWCPTLCDPVDCGPPGSSIHGILQSRILEWVTMPFSRGSSQPRNQNQVSCTAAGSLLSEPPGKWWLYSLPLSAFPAFISTAHHIRSHYAVSLFVILIVCCLFPPLQYKLCKNNSQYIVYKRLQQRLEYIRP